MEHPRKVFLAHVRFFGRRPKIPRLRKVVSWIRFQMIVRPPCPADPISAAEHQGTAVPLCTRSARLPCLTPPSIGGTKGHGLTELTPVVTQMTGEGDRVSERKNDAPQRSRKVCCTSEVRGVDVHSKRSQASLPSRADHPKNALTQGQYFNRREPWYGRNCRNSGKPLPTSCTPRPSTESSEPDQLDMTV